MAFLPDQSFTNPAGWRMRAERARKKIEAVRSPERLIVARIRAGMAAIETAANDARDEFARVNAPVPTPLPPVLHPHVAALVTAWWASQAIADPLAPLHGETCDEMIARYQAEARLGVETANAELREYETVKAQAEVDEAMAKLARVREIGADPVVTEGSAPPVTVLVADPKRPRGRPLVIVDEDEPIA